MGILPPQLRKLLLLVTGHTLPFTAVDLILTDPITQRRVIDPQLPSHLSNRPIRRPDNLNRIPLELDRELPPRPPCIVFLSQSDSPPGETPIIEVSGSRGELQLCASWSGVWTLVGWALVGCFLCGFVVCGRVLFDEPYGVSFDVR